MTRPRTTEYLQMSFPALEKNVVLIFAQELTKLMCDSSFGPHGKKNVFPLNPQPQKEKKKPTSKGWSC